MTNYTDTSDVSDAAIQRALDMAGSRLTVADVRAIRMEPGNFGCRAIINHARMIEKYEPDTLVDPLLEAVERLARIPLDEGGYGDAILAVYGSAPKFQFYRDIQRVTSQLAKEGDV